jgi:hypothetical protein
MPAAATASEAIDCEPRAESRRCSVSTYLDLAETTAEMAFLTGARPLTIG